MKTKIVKMAKVGIVVSATTMLFLGVLSDHLHAQTTNITGSGLNTDISSSGTTTFIDGGNRPGGGPNLFHSFGQFSVGTNHTALFRNRNDTGSSYDGAAIQNVFGRVTGNSISNIFGTIDSATNFPTANLWLINPVGFLFGPTASLNVGGSVNISTADYLKMTDGKLFFSDPLENSVLSMEPVAAFGFLERTTQSPTFGSITINGSKFGKPEFTDTDLPSLTGFSLVARNIMFTGAELNLSLDNVSADTVPSTVLLASVVSGGEVRLVPEGEVIGVSSQISAGTTLGHIALENTTISLGHSAGSLMRFFGDALTMRNSSIASELRSTSGGSLEFNLASRLLITGGEGRGIRASSLEGGDVIIHAPVVEVDGGHIATNGVIVGGKIHIFGNRVLIKNGEIKTSAEADASSGDLILDLKQSLFLGPNSRLRSEGQEQGTGVITIQAPVIDVNGGTISTRSSTNTGNITLVGDTVRIKNGEVSTTLKEEEAAPSQLGAANIMFNLTGPLLLGPGGTIRTSSIENLPAGDIGIRAGSVHLQGGTIDSRSEAAPAFPPSFPGDSPGFGDGRAGTISIHATEGILVTAGSTITSEFTWAGQAGNIVLNAGHDLRIQNGKITSAALPVAPEVLEQLERAAKEAPSGVTTGKDAISQCRICVGNAGEIRLTAGHDIQVKNSHIATNSPDGSGGNITLKAPNTIFIADSRLTSSVQGQQGSNGGNISIDPIAVAIQNSKILANANAGSGGTINIVASGAVLVDPNSQLSATAGPAGISGSVNINAPIQFLSGTLVPLKVSYSQPALSGDRCAADPQGQFSSFVQTGRDGVPQIPGGYAPSPLLSLNRLMSDVPGPRLAAARLGLASMGVRASTHYQFQSGCRS